MSTPVISFENYGVLLKLQRDTHHDLLRQLADKSKTMWAIEKELLEMEKRRSLLTFTRPKPENCDTQLTKLLIQINHVKDKLKDAVCAHQLTETKAKEQRTAIESTESMMKKHYPQKWAATKGIFRS